LNFTRGDLHLSLTAFVNRLSDAIANVSLGEGPGNFPGVGFVGAGGIYRQRQNVDGVNVRGLEASGEWGRGPWTVRAGLSLTHARMDASGAAASLDGLRPAQTPNFAATLAASWQKGGKGAQVVLRHLGAQYEDDLNSRRLHAATTLDAFGAWPLTDRLQIVARAENIFDKLVMAGIGGDGSVERATPRTFWIGLRLQ
jgi:outer membrane receptor protein involved in Fe transport